jgi:hypothetical protein
MLRSREAPAPSAPRPDPLVALNVAGMAAVVLGLLLAGVLAVYDWRTPGAEAPLVLWIAVVATALLVVDLLVVSVRHLRRLRLGL